MRRIKAFRNRDELIRLLDNGGHFYQMFCLAGDGSVMQGELEKAAEQSSDQVGLYIYLAMKMIELPHAQQCEVLQTMPLHIREAFEENRPDLLDPSHIETDGCQGQPVITSGFCKVEKQVGHIIGDVIRTEFSLYTNLYGEGDVHLWPVRYRLIDYFDVYSIFDTNACSGKCSVIATPRKKLESTTLRIRFGGVLQRL